MKFKNPLLLSALFFCHILSVSAIQPDTATHFYFVNLASGVRQMWNPPVNNFFRGYGFPEISRVQSFGGYNAGYCKGRYLTTIGITGNTNGHRISGGYETGMEVIDISVKELYRIYKNRFIDLYAGASIDAYESVASGDHVFDTTQITPKAKDMPEFVVDEWSMVLTPRVMLWHRLSNTIPVLRNFRIGAEAGYATRLFALSTDVSNYGPYNGYDNPAAYEAYHRPPDSHHIGNLFRSGFFIGLQLNFCVDRSYFFYR